MGNGCSMIFLHHVGVISYQNGNKTGTKLKHVHIFWKEGKKQVHRTAEYYFFFSFAASDNFVKMLEKN